ncbi:MAG: DNA mismatch repair protein MutS, partial [Candidatus Eremiobacterota bacterium]
MESRLTPLFVQYFDLKEAHPGCVMLMRVGDFYEAYGDDAERIARELEIALTAKESGEGRIAMAGVPFFSVDGYLRTLIAKGYRVAIAEQMEDARQAKGLVRREVVRVVTSGTILDPEMLDDRSHNFLLCAAHVGRDVGLAVADVSTGTFVAT